MKNLLQSAATLAIFTAISASLLSTGITAEDSDALYTNPAGTLRIEADGDHAVVISTKDTGQQASLPKESPDSEVEDEFHSSPDDQWIFALWHVGSGLRNGNLYHRTGPAKFDRTDAFNARAWKACVKLGALKENYSAAGVYAMTFFVCWSGDSSRLLIRLSGGDEKRDMRDGYLYFNTRKKSFETTPYLQAANKSKNTGMLCSAELVDPLPPESDLKTRYETLDRQLNKSYAARIARTEKDQVPQLRESQRAWLKNRDQGVAFYLKSTPAAEAKSRQFQFLADTTAARIDVLNSADNF